MHSPIQSSARSSRLFNHRSRVPVMTLKASNVIAVGSAHGFGDPRDSLTLKGSNEGNTMCDPFRVAKDHSLGDPGALPPAIESQPFRLPRSSRRQHHRSRRFISRHPALLSVLLVVCAVLLAINIGSL